MRQPRATRGIAYVARRRRYLFALRFASPGVAIDLRKLEARLVASGWDGVGVAGAKRGRVRLAFERTAASAEAAVLEALQVVREGEGRNLRLIEVEPDLVTLTEAAGWACCTREAMRRRELSDRLFPWPAHEGEPSLFHAADLLQWMHTRRRVQVPKEFLEIALVAREFNVALQARALSGGALPARVRAACGVSRWRGPCT